jgi:hypothetical protein
MKIHEETVPKIQTINTALESFPAVSSGGGSAVVSDIPNPA